MDTKAHHFLADIAGDFNDNAAIKSAMILALKKHNIPIVGEVDFEFKPHGYTLSILLAASHFYIHTYPEHQFAYCDCFTCGDFEPSLIVQDFCSQLNLKIATSQSITRSKI